MSNYSGLLSIEYSTLKAWIHPYEKEKKQFSVKKCTTYAKHSSRAFSIFEQFIYTNKRRNIEIILIIFLIHFYHGNYWFYLDNWDDYSANGLKIIIISIYDRPKAFYWKIISNNIRLQGVRRFQMLCEARKENHRSKLYRHTD